MLITSPSYYLVSSQCNALLLPLRILGCSELVLSSKNLRKSIICGLSYVSFLLPRLFWTIYLSHSLAALKRKALKKKKKKKRKKEKEKKALKPAYKQQQLCLPNFSLVFDQYFSTWSGSSEVFCKHQNNHLWSQAIFWSNFNVLLWFCVDLCVSFM